MGHCYVHFAFLFTLIFTIKKFINKFILFCMTLRVEMLVVAISWRNRQESRL